MADDIIIEAFNHKTNTWQPFATNTSPEWAAKDMQRYKEAEPSRSFRIKAQVNCIAS